MAAVDIREIKEVREGTDSKDFERQQVELKKIDQFCFVIYYMAEFKAKSLSVAGTGFCNLDSSIFLDCGWLAKLWVPVSEGSQHQPLLSHFIGYCRLLCFIDRNRLM